MNKIFGRQGPQLRLADLITSIWENDSGCKSLAGKRRIKQRTEQAAGT